MVEPLLRINGGDVWCDAVMFCYTCQYVLSKLQRRESSVEKTEEWWTLVRLQILQVFADVAWISDYTQSDVAYFTLLTVRRPTCLVRSMKIQAWKRTVWEYNPISSHLLVMIGHDAWQYRRERTRMAQNKRPAAMGDFWGPILSGQPIAIVEVEQTRARDWGPTGGGSPACGVPASGRPPAAPLDDAARLDDDVDLVAEAARGGRGGRGGGGGRHGAGAAVLAAAQLTWNIASNSCSYGVCPAECGGGKYREALMM